MSKQKQLAHMSKLTHRLHAAADAGDWQATAAADRELAAALPVLAAQGEWTPDERAALEKLRVAHQQAQEHCARELVRVGKHLGDMQEHKEGWIAYALSSNLEEGRT
ncbi:hypothetical protein D3870_20035 [Noviherbaspirillum cavernae]|uniref:Flagellar protein FliT n=1 Tax=Noviherbaspirillum cavernae TaxID=2320862 RepID=A0A418WVZ7_9BURK|nr:hypothetical protein [Noviherbaspirillum cavernae]RJF96701.1 hypothetical protein D3870_20035 [Noviherbaspirillum cavernae]